MAETQFAAWKYQHSGQAGVSAKRWKWVLGTAIVAGGAALAFFPGGLFLGIVPLLIYFTAPKQIALGPRYLICGSQIVYYGNVASLSLDRAAGRLTLVSANAKSLVIEQAKFPTNARKSHKVAANKATKFAKVAEKIIEKVRNASPTVELSGVSGT